MIERFHAIAPARDFGAAVEARPAYELLIGLYALTIAEPRPSEESWVPPLAACSAPLRRAVAAVGVETGELWLHLLGLAVELPAESAAAWARQLADVDAAELRRHLVGVHVPAWRAAVGADALERAAAGDPDAAAAIVTDDCYYGGQGAAALSRLLPLSPAQSKRRVLDVVQRFAAEVFEPREDELMRRLHDEAVEQRLRIEGEPPEAAVASVTGGYAYEREPELDRVLLIPHLAAPPWLLLCQHRTVRIICYAATKQAVEPEQQLRERALQLGRALGDEKRIEILRLLAAGETTLNELAAATGLVKSTVHHHLAQLRAAGLVTIDGNARGYRYSLRAEGLPAGRSLLDELFEH